MEQGWRIFFHSSQARAMLPELLGHELIRPERDRARALLTRHLLRSTVPLDMPVLLDVQDLSVRFGGLVALAGVSFAVPAGEVVALLGPNGAGKTTLFNVLTGVVRPSTGRIRFNGQDLSRYRTDQISRLGISRTFQLIRVFPGLSVEDNIRVGGVFGRTTTEPPLQDHEVHDLLNRTGLRHLARQVAGRLAIGDRKRLEIARALATRPRLLLFDEVIAGLAPPDVRALTDLIRTIQQQRITIILIEHIMPVVFQLADRVIVLHHGEEIAEGPPSLVVRDPVVIEAYLGEVPLAQPLSPYGKDRGEGLGEAPAADR